MPTLKMFDSNRSIQDHLNHYDVDARSFMNSIEDRVANKVFTTSSQKSKILIALWIASQRTKTKDDFDHAWRMFSMSPGDIFKFVDMLDSPRQARALRSKLQRWTNARLPVNPKKYRRMESKIKDLEADVHDGCLTSSMAKRLRHWVGAIPADQLDFYILNYPETLCMWKGLADLCHFAETDFQNPYFLSVVFGKEIPVGTRLHALKNINTENFVSSIEKYPDFTSCYSYLRQKVKRGELVFTPNNKRVFAKTAPLSDLLWFYEELAGPELDDVITHRLNSGETVTSGPDERASFPAKLMERIMMLQKHQKPYVNKLIECAEERLSLLRMAEVEGWNVGILGDCSGSMDVAVETASIVSGLLSVGLNAELIFFNGVAIRPPLDDGRAPQSVKDVLEVAHKVSATGCTSPAAGLKHFYDNAFKKKGKKIDMFIVVTDEEENTPVSLQNRYIVDFNRFQYAGGYGMQTDGIYSFDFAQLLEKYRKDVNPNVQVMFISFLRQGDRGSMVERLSAVMGDLKVRQYQLDKNLPDLSKFTELLGVVRMTLNEFSASRKNEKKDDDLTKRKKSKKAKKAR